MKKISYKMKNFLSYFVWNGKRTREVDLFLELYTCQSEKRENYVTEKKHVSICDSCTDYMHSFLPLKA